MSDARGCIPMNILGGGAAGNVSDSTKRCPRKIDIVRLVPLGHLGVDFDVEYFGDSITWTELASIGLKYGTNTIIKYSMLEPGWKYEYDAYGRMFYVTDNIGNITAEKIDNLSDMGIVWDILNSHQFRVFYSPSFINDAFLIAWHKKKGYIYDDDGHPIKKDITDNTITTKEYIAAYVDQYYSNEPYHHVCNRLVKNAVNITELSNELMQDFVEAEKITILRSNIPVRSAKGDYSDIMVKPKDNDRRAVATKRRNVIIDIVFGEFLMIAAFATIMNRGKPVYEPWMLWELWKWLGNGTPIIVKDKIFDLSPNWG